ncbi:Zinc finger protein [Pseudolycoriella hygida]|uniref:Zinc finger protein n=1 Tax=Pseudolycoriella hygida TaxID=35572 RepID=A0A9Q0MRI1_9DIPT|nr:Zinc finger protein [Pseudolycoriella hygida]
MATQFTVYHATTALGDMVDSRPGLIREYVCRVFTVFTEMDLKAVCRTCLKEAAEMRSIYEGDAENPLSTMITSISDTTVMISEIDSIYPNQMMNRLLKASELDGLPGQICIECVDILRQSVQFKRQCESAYETLKNVLGVFIQKAEPFSVSRATAVEALDTTLENESLICGPNEKCVQTEDICFYPCEMCEQKFFKEESLKEHRLSHKNKQTGFKCRNCDRSYVRLSHLRRHINIVHPEVGISGKLDNSYCKQCDKHFTRPEHLRRHMVTHQDNAAKSKLKLEKEDGVLKCDECGEIFHSQNTFDQHENCRIKVAITDDEKQSIAKIELNEEDILFEPEVNVETSIVDVPVKSEIHSDDDEIIPAEEDSVYAMETTADEEMQIDALSDTDVGNSSAKKIISKVRRAQKSPKQSPETSTKNATKSPKSKKSTASQEKIHQCNKCDKIFNRATHLKRHIATHSDIKPYSCEICDKRFRRVDHLNIHRHHHSSIKPHVCDVCQKGFTRSEHLRKHKECRHGDKTQVAVKTEFCNICQKGFTTPKYLQVHMKSHTNRTFACKFCEDKFGTKAELNEHQKTHVNERPFLCSECGLRFVRNDYLVIHMRRHKGEKPYKCKYCNKGFPRATDLTVHERYHTGEKTHLCTICGKGFQRAYNLLVHTRVHTGERPYKCPHCVKSFAQGNDLKAHVRRHTGERYKCDICSEGFIQGYHLTQHKRNVHGIDMKSHIRRVEKFIPVAENVEIQELNLYQMQQSEQLRKLQQETDEGPVDFRNHFKVINEDGTINIMSEDNEEDVVKLEQTHMSQDSRSSDIIVTQNTTEQIDQSEGILPLNIFSGLHSKLKLSTPFHQ